MNPASTRRLFSIQQPNVTELFGLDKNNRIRPGQIFDSRGGSRYASIITGDIGSPVKITNRCNGPCGHDGPCDSRVGRRPPGHRTLIRYPAHGRHESYPRPHHHASAWVAPLAGYSGTSATVVRPDDHVHVRAHGLVFVSVHSCRNVLVVVGLRA